MGLILWLFMFAGSSQAFARTYDNNLRKSVTYKAELSELTDLSDPRLDWRNPKVDIKFQLPSSDWVDSVDLFLNVQADKRPNRGAPLYVHFNNAPPTPIYAKGYSFTAQVKLDPAHIKARRNVIGLSYAKDDGGGCIEPSDGSWTIDLDDSLVLVKSTTPSSLFDMSDVKDILSSSLSAPKTVSIIAKGDDKLTYEALAAQGTALNMVDLPRFSLAAGSSDLEIHVGTRRELSRLIRGTDLGKSKGPVMGVTRNAPLRLVMTADNEAQLLQLVQSYAAYVMPPTSRSYSTKSDFVWEKAFSDKYQSVSGKTDIFDIEFLNFGRGWGDNAQVVEFDVDNPIMAHGQAKLFFQRGPMVSPESLVNISLNGQSLGDVALKHKRNVVQFDIPRGLLHGTDNKLSIKPDLTPIAPQTGCAASETTPEFFVEDKSYLNIKNEAAGYAGDLTRLSASAYPFSQDAGQGTNIILSGVSNSDKTAALRTLSRLAKAYGSGLIDARYYTLATAPNGENKHTLLIGPKLDSAAPKGLASLMDGRMQKPKIIQTASVGPAPVSLLSVREVRVRGGIAALYEDAKHTGRLRGYITSSKGHSFNRAIENLLRGEHWNELQGSMARWNRDKVEMSKTAFNVDAPTLIAPVNFSPVSVSKGADMPKLRMPELTLPKVDVQPAAERVAIAGQSAVNGIANAWNALSQKITQALEPAQESRVITPVQISNPQNPTAAKYDLVQYQPGAAVTDPSLRASAKLSVRPPVKEPVTSVLKNKVSAGFNKISNGMDRVIDRTQNSFFTDKGSENTHANVLVMAILAMMFLIVIGLARPRV